MLERLTLRLFAFLGALVFLAPVAHAQGNRRAKLQCRNLGAGSATATLTWTTNRGDLPGPVTLTCNDSNSAAQDITQPEQANDWHLTIVISDAAGNPVKTCNFNDPLFFPGNLQNIRETCRVGDPTLAKFTVGRIPKNQ